MHIATTHTLQQHIHTFFFSFSFLHFKQHIPFFQHVCFIRVLIIMRRRSVFESILAILVLVFTNSSSSSPSFTPIQLHLPRSYLPSSVAPISFSSSLSPFTYSAPSISSSSVPTISPSPFQQAYSFPLLSYFFQGYYTFPTLIWCHCNSYFRMRGNFRILFFDSLV